VRSDGQNLVDDVFDTDDVIFLQSLFDQKVVGNGESLCIDLGEPSLVNNLTNGFKIRGAKSDVRLNETKHVDGGAVKFDEDSVVDLSQAKKLKNLFGSGINAIDTTDSDNKGKFGLGLSEKSAMGLGTASFSNQMSLTGLVFLVILLSSSNDDFTHLLFPQRDSFFDDVESGSGFTSGLDHLAETFRDWGADILFGRGLGSFSNRSISL